MHGSLDLLLQAERKILADLEPDPSPRWSSCWVIMSIAGAIPAAFSNICCKRRPRRFAVSPFAATMSSSSTTFSKIRRKTCTGWILAAARRFCLTGSISTISCTKGRLRQQPFRDALLGAIPQPHRQLLSSLPVYARIGSYIFVHAGFRPGLPLDAQTDEDMLWIREPFLSQGAGLDLLVVHGHTPVEQPETGPQRIGIDTGAYTTGRLTILRPRMQACT